MEHYYILFPGISWEATMLQGLVKSNIVQQVLFERGESFFSLSIQFASVHHLQKFLNFLVSRRFNLIFCLFPFLFVDFYHFHKMSTNLAAFYAESSDGWNPKISSGSRILKIWNGVLCLWQRDSSLANCTLLNEVGDLVKQLPVIMDLGLIGNGGSSGGLCLKEKRSASKSVVVFARKNSLTLVIWHAQN